MGMDTGNEYSAPDFHDHMTGYDSVQGESSWSDATRTNAIAWIAAFETLLGTYQTNREAYVQTVLDQRKNRLLEIHDDNLFKIEAPFDLQLDLLGEEEEDITQAKAYARDDALNAFDDLKERMTDYLNDRNEALDREADRVIRTLERALSEKKDLTDVLYAMRLDWLQGVYVSGNTAAFDNTVWDSTVYDNEFDIFSFDIGHGKGHGHRAGAPAPQNDRRTGFVSGARGADGDINVLKGRPVPVDGQRRRYDKATQSGHGAPYKQSDYELGLENSRAVGQYNYNQAADLGLEEVIGGRRGQAPSRRPPSTRPPSTRPPSTRPDPRSRSSMQRRPAPTTTTARRPAP